WSSPVTASGNTATGTIDGIGYTYTSDQTVNTSPAIFDSYNVFPTSAGSSDIFSFPRTAHSVIRNIAVTSNTIEFDEPVTDPVLVFSSIGGPAGAVPVVFGQPIEVLWMDHRSGGSWSVSQDSPTQITGHEGYAIVRMPGTHSSISFDYTAAENYANFLFGISKERNCNPDLDLDNDWILDCDENGLNEDPTSAFVLLDDANVPSNLIAGSAYQIQLTPNSGNKRGTAWTRGQVDFTEDFMFSMKVNLGSNTGGADGLAVVFHNSSQGTAAKGAVGGGLGAQGIANGIALELDTHRNSTAPHNDPVADHGTIRRTSNWAALSGTAPLNPTVSNVKDGNWHELKVYWSATTSTLNYTFDGNQVTSYAFPVTGTNSIASILGGTKAYFGYTGSTGLLFNDQRIGFDDPCSIPVFLDTDGDGIPNHLDLDSDGDGCPD